MATSNDSILQPGRAPLTLHMAERPRAPADVDGEWWPQSRDLAVELADLVDHFPPGYGQVVRALYSPPDWEAAPRRVRISRGFLKVGGFPRDDTHLMLLKMSGRTTLRLLVLGPERAPAPPASRPDQGGLDPDGHGNDDGGSGQGPLTEPPAAQRRV